jgi:hypothetical protein
MAKKIVITLTPAQKAAATKRAMGLDLSAIAAKAVATRRENTERAEKEARAAFKARSLAAKRAVATRRANQAAKAAPAKGRAKKAA